MSGDRFESEPFAQPVANTDDWRDNPADEEVAERKPVTLEPAAHAGDERKEVA